MQELVLLLKLFKVKTKTSQQLITNASHTYVYSQTYKTEQSNSNLFQIILFYLSKTFSTKVQVQFILIVLIKITLLLINFVHLKVNQIIMVYLHISKAASTVQSSKDQFLMEEIALLEVEWFTKIKVFHLFRKQTFLIAFQGLQLLFIISMLNQQQMFHFVILRI